MTTTFSSWKPDDHSAGEKLLELKKTENIQPYQRIYGGCESRYGSRAGQKSKSAAHNQVVLVKNEGYTLSRSPSRVKMSIQTAAFFGEPSDQIRRPSGSAVSAGCSTSSTNIMGSDRINTSKASNRSGSSFHDRQLTEALDMYENLQLEMAELRLNMDSEKEELKAQIAILEEKCEEDRKVLSAAHEQEVEDLNREHYSFIAELEERHTFEARSITTNITQEKVKLERQIEFLEKSLITVKEEMKHEREDQIRMKDNKIHKMKEDHRKELEVMEEKMRETSSTEMILLQEKLTDHHKREMKSLKVEHKKEVDDLISQLSRLKQLEEEAAKSSKIIKKLEKKNSRLKQEIKYSEAKKIMIQAQLLETETALENFKKEFETKVRDVEAKLRDRLDNLLLENSQLRKKLLAKTEEFCRYKVNVERSNDRTIQSFKEKVQVLLNARTRAKLGMALGISEESLLPPDSALRPSSAPSTDKESDMIRHSFLASEESLRQQLRRPKTSFPLVVSEKVQ